MDHLKAAGPLGSLGLVTRWQQGKLVVTSAHTNGRAARAGVQIGDRIVAVDGVALTEQVPPAPPRPSSLQRNVVLAIDRGRSRHNLIVALTHLVAKSAKPSPARSATPATSHEKPSPLPAEVRLRVSALRTFL